MKQDVVIDVRAQARVAKLGLVTPVIIAVPYGVCRYALGIAPWISASIGFAFSIIYAVAVIRPAVRKLLIEKVPPQDSDLPSS
jgi:hypothetical protein